MSRRRVPSTRGFGPPLSQGLPRVSCGHTGRRKGWSYAQNPAHHFAGSTKRTGFQKCPGGLNARAGKGFSPSRNLWEIKVRHRISYNPGGQIGGTGSGNHGGRPTVEAALELNLHHLIRQGSFQPGATVAGSLAWTNSDTGEQRASIGYEAHMGQEDGWCACATQPRTAGPWRPPSTITPWS